MKKMSIAISVVLFLLILISCGGNREAPADDIGFNETGYPIVNKPLTLRAIAGKSDTTMEYNEIPVFKELEKKTNIHIEWEYAGADWATQKPLVLASGNLPDLFVCKGAVVESDVISNMDLFVQLDPLIEKYAPNIKGIFAADSTFRKFNLAYDGHIYGLAQRMPRRPEIYTITGINQQWLDTLGLKMPTTTEELYNMLKAFKTQDPNGNGKADEIPLCYMGFNALHGFMDLFGSFGIADSINNWLTVTDGKVQYIPIQDGFKDAIVFFHRLYAEGLMDNEIFTMTRNQVAAKQNPPADQPDLVGMGGTWSRDLAFGTARSRHYSVYIPVKGPRGHQYWRKNADVVQGTKYVFEITTNCKYPEAAIRWADTIYEENISLQMYFGPMDEYIQVKPDGTYYIVPPPEGYTNSQWRWRIQTNDRSMGYTSAETSAKIDDPLFDEQLLAKENLMPYTPKEYFPLVAMTPDELTELSTLRTDIQSYAESQAATWIANGGAEVEYDAFVKQLESMGVKRMVEIYQGAYDRYLSQ
jgi:putative aldouronate transport system substrate-binding protein